MGLPASATVMVIVLMVLLKGIGFDYWGDGASAVRGKRG